VQLLLSDKKSSDSVRTADFAKDAGVLVGLTAVESQEKPKIGTKKLAS
jgi:hypothetical protein